MNGNTAIEGLSGNGSDALAGGSGAGVACFSGDPDIEHADRPGDVLDLLLAPVVEGEVELVADLVAHDAADADPAGLGQGFEPCGDIDAVAVDVVLIADDVAEIDADAELDPPLRRDGGVAHGHLALHVDRAAHRIDDAAELHQQAVAGGLDDAAAMLLDLGVGQFAPQHLQAIERAFLVRAHQPRVARDIGGENGGKAAGSWHLSRRSIVSTELTPKPIVTLASRSDNVS